MIRSLKKLKAWSKKRITRKRKRVDPLGGVPAPDPHCCACASHSSAPQFRPTAPPLPPWLDFQQHCGVVISDPIPAPAPGVVFPVPAPAPAAGTGSEITRLWTPPPRTSIPSYQQYIVPDPVYGVPIAPPPPDERAPGPPPPGCSGVVEAWLHRCLFCCFGRW